MLFKSENLIERLRSFKHYFLLDQSDFLTHFLDLASGELMKPKSDVSITSLRSILELVIRNPGSSSAQFDSYKEDISVELSPYSLVEQLLKVTSVSGLDYDALMTGDVHAEEMVKEKREMDSAFSGGLIGSRDCLTGFDTVMLGVTVPFPVSLILNKRVITKYQLLFRHLLHCKNIERLLSLAWMIHTQEKGAEQYKRPNVPVALSSSSKRSSSTSRVSRSTDSLAGSSSSSSRVDVSKKPLISSVEHVPASLTGEEQRERSHFARRMSLLRSRMLNFVQQFLHFICFEVIDPHWRMFESRLVEVATVDEVLDCHNNFLDSCLKDGMLTNPKLLKAFGKVTRSSLHFVAFVDAYARKRQDRLAAYNPASDSFSTPFANQFYDSFEGLSNCEDFVSLATGSPADIALRRLEQDQIVAVRAFINSLNFLGAADSTPRLQDLVTRLDYNAFYSKNFVQGLSSIDLLG